MWQLHLYLQHVVINYLQHQLEYLKARNPQRGTDERRYASMMSNLLDACRERAHPCPIAATPPTHPPREKQVSSTTRWVR